MKRMDSMLTRRKPQYDTYASSWFMRLYKSHDITCIRTLGMSEEEKLPGEDINKVSVMRIMTKAPPRP